MRAIELTDDFGIKGSLEVIKSLASTGAEIERFEDHNMVVNGGRSGMAHLWAGQWFTGPPTGYVNLMKFGDRGHDTSDATLAKTTQVTRTQLFCQDEARPIIITKSVTTDFPDGDSGTKVRFTCTVGASEGNGTGRQGYSEAGLYRVDGLLAAHKPFGLITKTPEFILTFRWTFKF